MSDPGGARKPDEEPSVLGVRLDRYAGVTAALAEGIPLRDVLAQERIDEAAWPAADRAWKEALVETPDLLLRFMKLRRQAEDTLSRRVEPLEDDAAAWAGLLGELSLSDDADRVLQSLGLRMTDIGRLGRSWRAKAEKDSAVAKRLADLAGKAQPPKAVRCGPTVLRRFPWSPTGAERAAPPDKTPVRASDEPPVLDPPIPDDAARPVAVPSYLAAPPAVSLGGAALSFTSSAADQTLPLASNTAEQTLPFAPSAAPDLSAPPKAELPKARVETGTVDASGDRKSPETDAGGAVAGLTLTQYASLLAELGADPTNTPAILAKYGLPDEAAKRKVTDAWDEVLLRDAKKRARWMQLIMEFRAWLAQQKKQPGG